MAEVKWIKITTDIFDDEKILLVEAMHDADAVIVIWFKLLCLAGKMNNSGVFVMAGRIAYTDEMLATIFRRPVNTVRMALNLFEQFGMIEIIDGVITIPNWNKHQSLDVLEAKRERDRLYQAKRREQQRLIANQSSDTSPDIASQIREDKKRLDKNREEKSIDIRHKYGSYSNVLLSDEEMQKLQAEFPEDYRERIDRLSEYIASRGNKYKSHLATIRAWARKDAEVKAKKEELPF